MLFVGHKAANNSKHGDDPRSLHHAPAALMCRSTITGSNGYEKMDIVICNGRLSRWPECNTGFITHLRLLRRGVVSPTRSSIQVCYHVPPRNKNTKEIASRQAAEP